MAQCYILSFRLSKLTYIFLLSFVMIGTSSGLNSTYKDVGSLNGTSSANSTSRNFQFHKVSNKLPSCTCGVKASHDVKIVGGVLSKQHCWPWVAAIVYISESKGHCIEYILDEGLKNFRVILGTNDINDKDAIVLEIESAIPHPKYDPKSLEYDVGILELDTPLEFSQKVLPICLTPQDGVPYVNKSAIVAGWGSTYFGGAPTTKQMQIMLGVISNSECQTLYGNDTEVTNTMMCARRSNTDSCQGDSGGPLFLLQDGTNDHYLQIGIVSFGKGCGDTRYPGIYSRVSRFTRFIKSRIENDSDSNCNRRRVKNRYNATG